MGSVLAASMSAHLREELPQLMERIRMGAACCMPTPGRSMRRLTGAGDVASENLNTQYHLRAPGSPPDDCLSTLQLIWIKVAHRFGTQNRLNNNVGRSRR